MIRQYLASLLLLNALLVAPVLAQDAAETVTFSDLGVESPSVLPTNPLYFLKEWRRGIQRFFTFGALAKAEFALRIADQKAAEAKKVKELLPNNIQAVNEALENYTESQERLKTRLEALRETSENPNIDKLLEKLAERSVKHFKVIDEVVGQTADKNGVKKAALEAKNKIAEAIGKAAEKDDPEKFSLKLEKALVETRGGELKHMRSVEIIDILQKAAPEKVKDELEKLRGDFSSRLTDDVKELLEKEDEAKIQKAIEDLPGDKVRRAAILEEIRQNAERRVADVISKAQVTIDQGAAEERNTASRAEEQIKRAGEIIKKLETRLNESKDDPLAARNLFKEALDNLKEAHAAFENQKYGEAFGQARSAEALAHNALRLLEEEKQETRPVPAAIPAKPAERRETEETAVVKPAEPAKYELKIEADDNGFYPSGIVTVTKGAAVKIHFIVRQEGVYFGGLDIRSSKFKTGTLKPGSVASVEFTADESFEFQSWWPASNVLKARGKVVVE